MKSRRLFLLAGYSARGAVDESLVYMVQSLSTHGDIILVMDCDVPAPELDKLRTYVLHADAHRHGEYDFGSYKRAYIYARDTAILSKYDYIYMINDSVYGPTRPIGPYFETMESFGVPVFGLVCNPHHERPHIQSWFIGMRRDTVCTDWFDRFITSVRPQRDKGAITYLYEQGFTKLITAQNIAYRCIFSVPGRSIYNSVRHLYRNGMPFIKKASFTRHNGCLGRQIRYVLSHTDKNVRDAILSSARDSLGDEYIDWLLTKNPFKILYRNVRYFFHKIRTEKL